MDIGKDNSSGRAGNSSGAENGTPEAVADAWSALAGRWKADFSVEAEIASIYEARSGGRELDLA